MHASSLHANIKQPLRHHGICKGISASATGLQASRCRRAESSPPELTAAATAHVGQRKKSQVPFGDQAFGKGPGIGPNEAEQKQAALRDQLMPSSFRGTPMTKKT